MISLRQARCLLSSVQTVSRLPVHSVQVQAAGYCRLQLCSYLLAIKKDLKKNNNENIVKRQGKYLLQHPPIPHTHTLEGKIIFGCKPAAWCTHVSAPFACLVCSWDCNICFKTHKIALVDPAKTLTLRNKKGTHPKTSTENSYLQRAPILLEIGRTTDK